MVAPKKNGKMSVCIDFMDLSRASPKDSFPLPHINQIVSAMVGHKLLSFLDAFSRYNQILMHPIDEEKMSFISKRNTYCYKRMPFEMRSQFSKANQQKVLINACKDMLVESTDAKDHARHLE